MISFALVCSVALVFPACSQQEAPTLGEPGDASEVDRTVAVTADEFNFSLDEIDAEVDETIEFVITNDGKAQHEFTIGTTHEHSDAGGHPTGSGSTGAIDPGDEATLIWTFTESGETNFACYIDGHDKQGMTGTITVIE